MDIPYKMPLASEAVFTGYRVFALMPDGTIYARLISNNLVLYKSTDWGATWTTVYTATAQIIDAKVTNKGNVLVCTNDKKVFRSDVNEANFTEVLEMQSAGASFYQGFNFDIYDNVVVIGEYGSDADKMYFSSDYGATFSKIFDHPMIGAGTFHLQGVAYDPYENLIWGCSGDGYPQNQVFYSYDFGKSWNWLREGLQLRATAIIPLPECVLILSDDNFERAAYAHYRPKNGTRTKPLAPVKAYQPSPYFDVSGGDPWNGDHVVTFGKDAFCLFGWHQSDGNIQSAAELFYTQNGRDFTCIWSTNRLPVVDAGISARMGMRGVYGPTANNEILVQYQSNEDGAFYHAIKINL